MLKNETQIKAARAFLNWTQGDLAKRANVSLPTIINIEKSKNPIETVRGSTFNHIVSAFEREGIIFTPNGGIDIKHDIATELSGDNWFVEILDDIYNTLLDKPNAEVLIFGGDNSVTPPNIFNLFKKIKNSGIAIREMIKDGNTFMHGAVKDYRWIDKKYYKNYIKVIYGNKIVLDFGDTGILIKNPDIATVERNQFNMIWDFLPELNMESTADVRY